LFGEDVGIELVQTYPIPSSADDHPKFCVGKLVRKNPKAPKFKHQNNCAYAFTFNASIQKVTRVPHSGFGCIISLKSGVQPWIVNYMLTILSFPKCSCLNFKEMKLNGLEKHGSWANCKHFYYIFTVICNLQSTVDVSFIHAVSMSFTEMKHVLLSGILFHLGSN